MSRSSMSLGALAVLLTAGPAVAQQSSNEMGGSERELGGHRFIPSRNVPEPFLASRFTTAIGFGSVAGLTVPIYNYEDSLVRELEGDMGFLSIDFEYQQQLTSWLALRGGVGAVARAGVDAFSFAAEGLSTVYGANLGATGRILGNERFLLSATVDYSTSSLYGVQPITYLQGVAGEVRQAVQDFIDAGGTVDSESIDSILGELDLSEYDVVESGSASRTSVGLRAAYAAAPWLGFTVATQSGVGDLFGRSELGIIDVGATASLDFSKLWNVPVGVALAARYHNANERVSDIASDLTTFGAFISYAARRDLALGVDISNASLGQTTGGTVRVTRGAVTMTYYF